MECLIERYEIVESLQEIACYKEYNDKEKGFGHYALGLFKQLNYPIEDVDKNNYGLSIEEFLSTDLPFYKSKAMFKYLKYIDSISELFTIDYNTIETGIYYSHHFEIHAITFLAIELKDIDPDDDYKYWSRNMTELISTLYHKPIFIMYKHRNKLCFSLPLIRIHKCDDSKDITQSKYSTKWMDALQPDKDLVEICEQMKAENLEFNNLGELYFSLFYSLGYNIDPDELEVERKQKYYVKRKKKRNDYIFERMILDYKLGYKSRLFYDELIISYIHKYILESPRYCLTSNNNSNKEESSKQMEDVDINDEWIIEEVEEEVTECK